VSVTSGVAFVCGIGYDGESMRIRDILNIDFPLLFAVIGLTVIGVLSIYSSGMTAAGVQTSDEYVKQIIWGSIGFASIVILTLIDYRRFHNLSLYLYLASLVVLLYTFLLGRLVNGARSWIGLGSFGIQPSEFTKVTTILLLARYLDDTKRKAAAFSRFFVSCIIVFVPMVFILIQPDFGTSLVFIPILLIMTFIAGVSIRYIIFLSVWITLTAVLMALPLYSIYILKNTFSPIMVLTNFRFVAVSCAAFTIIALIALTGYLLYKKPYFFWIVYGAIILILALGTSFMSFKVLKDYQVKRLIVFLDPDVDPQGAGWNIIQSIIAIGSGGLRGMGYLQGTQSHYSFLPQQSTDFIFSIFSEEAGFTGGILVFVLFLIICLRLIRVMKLSPDAFGGYIIAGLATVYIFHFLINIGMTMGIMPITGIPLLFMSYGGSALTTAMIGVGLVQSVYARRFEHPF
jgi:rod shape determining protein RodA